MALKLLVPVLPTERFYDTVVAAADLLTREGGTLTFLFTSLRPPPEWEDQEDDGFQTGEAADADLVDEPDDKVEAWQAQMRAGLSDAFDLLRERGVVDEQVNVVFADGEAPPARSIADEAAAGSYDFVVLSKGELIELSDGPLPDDAKDIAEAVRELSDDGVKLLVT